MLTTLLRAFLVGTGAWIIWHALKHFITKSTLDNLPGPPSSSLLLGNVRQLFSPDGWDFHYSMLKTYGSTMTVKGVLGERILVTYDPKALHHILVKDQPMYDQSFRILSRNDIFFGDGLLATYGEQHRKQRKMMNPVFSINHMRTMIPTFYEVAERLRALLVKGAHNGIQEIDVLNYTTRTALEIIGQSGMGYSFDSLTDDHDYHPYSRSVKRFTALAGGTFGFLANQFVFPSAVKFRLPRLKRFIVERMPFYRVQELKNITDIMYETSMKIIDAKTRGMNSNDPEVVEEMASKMDIISILMRANATVSKEDRLSDSEILSQVSTFVFAGMDTTSSATSRILHLLSLHADVQEKLRNEIREAQSEGQLTYDQLVTLPYLDAVCRETLRVHPPINFGFMRTAVTDMILPLSKPVVGQGGKEMTEILVPKGTNILVSILGANCNPDLWGPDSYEWKPERWLSPLPEAVGEAHVPGIYSHLMTFLGGTRACIGFKFAQLEMKVVLSILLSTFKFSPSKKEVAWKMNSIVSPAIEGEDGTRLQLPLNIALVNENIVPS